MDFLSSFTGVDLSLWGWIIVLTAGSFVGIAKTALPGIGILVVVLMAMALPSRMSVGVVLPLLLLGDLFALGKYWNFTDKKQLFLLLPFALTGLGIGYVVLRHVSNEELKPLIGGVVLLMLFFHQISRFVKKRKGEGESSPIGTHPLVTAVFGFFGGFGSGMANAAGPVLSLYFLIAGLPKLQFLATTAWFFFILNMLKLPLYVSLGLINLQSLKVNLLALPSVALGAFLGYWLVKRIPQERFNQAVLLLAFAAALKLVL